MELLHRLPYFLKQPLKQMPINLHMRYYSFAKRKEWKFMTEQMQLIYYMSAIQ
jgi:hypothetical protein